MKKQLILSAITSACLMSATASHSAEWEYKGDHGPAHWGDMYEMCGGQQQSPINITGANDANLPEIQFDYSISGNEVTNNGHTVQVNFADGNQITVADKTFALKQFHFHAPSENTVDGTLYPLEVHLVHVSDSGEIAVIGVFFEMGEANAEVAKAWDNMPSEGETKDLAQTALAQALLPESKDYYAFSGSLTTPPCSEGVNWMVMKQPLTVSEAQVKQFMAVMDGHNNRPVQPLNDRTISQ